MKSTTKWRMTAIRVKYQVWEDFKKIAYKKGTNPTNLLRQLIYEFLAKNEI